MERETPQFEEPNGSIEVETLVEIKDRVGEDFDSEPILIDQHKVDLFLEATGDNNPIHFSEEEINSSVLAEDTEGKLIVPGYLTLSLSANKGVLYEALKIQEPHELVSLGVDDVRFKAPVPVGARVKYKYILRSAENSTIKSRESIKVIWDITASIGDKECMTGIWTLGYVTKNP